MTRIPFLTPFIALLIPIVSAFGQDATAPKQIEFKFKYQPGQVVTQRLVSRNVGSIGLPAPLPEQKMSQTMEETLVAKCLSVNSDGSGEFEMKIAALAIKMTVGPITVNYDSRTYDPSVKKDFMTDLMSQMFGSMNGLTFNATIASTGQVVKMKGLAEAMKKIIQTLEGSKEAAVIKSMFDQMGSSLEDNAFLQEVQTLYRLVPGKAGPYRVGDKWDHAWKLKLPGIGTAGMAGRGDYELVGIETFQGHPCARIRMKESFKLEMPKAGVKPAGGGNPLAAILDKLQFQLTSNSGEGYAYLDYTTGELVKMRTTQSFDMRMSLQADPHAKNEKEREGMQMNMNFRTSAAADLVEPGSQGTDSLSDARLRGVPATKPAANSTGPR